MCGIVGYLGKENAVPIIIECLKDLEYRGYDSAGLAFLDKNTNNLEIRRCAGKVADLDKMLELGCSAFVALGHTRWATHGRPSKENAHPHCDCSGKLVVVHNGIIENYISLKEMLLKEGHKFTSQTDTEVIAHLIEKNYQGNLYEAVKKSVDMIDGSFALGVLHENHPDEIVVTKRHSPLILGLGENENFIASDIPAILKHTKNVIYLEDEEFAIVSCDKVIVLDKDGKEIKKEIVVITWDVDRAQKNGFEHFMLKEIFEQTMTVRETWKPRVIEDTGQIYIEGMNLSDEEMRSIQRIVIVSCGTSWHAGMIGRVFMEKLAHIPVSVEYASEFRYTDPILDQNTLTIGISQSGETADTLAAIREAKRRGCKVISICNVFGSSIARESDGVIYTYAGPEIGVASTKAFTAQIVGLYLFALSLARAKGTVEVSELLKMVESLKSLEEKIPQVLDTHLQCKGLADFLYKSRNFLYLGRGIGFAVALEGALKLKEISYIHAEGYHAGEMKHGPIALIDEEMPVVVLALQGRRYSKIINNIEEIKARRGIVIAIATQGDESIKDLADYVIYIPEVDEFLSPILAVVPMQFLAYYIAVKRECNVDQPRNLAKSVTVE